MININPIQDSKVARKKLLKGDFSNKVVWFVIVFIFYIAPMLVPSYVLDIWTKFVIYALFALAYDLIYGHAGLLSLGHAAFFGAGAYAVAILMFHYDITSFWITMPCALVTAVLVAVLYGVLALRVSGFYFLLVTFALGQLLYSVVWNIKWFSTPGMQGISGVDWPTLGLVNFEWNEVTFYLFVASVSFVCVYFLTRIMYSHFGYALRGVREDELKMAALGYNTWLVKYLGFVVSGAFSGIAGGLFAYYSGFVSPMHVGTATSFIPMVMVIVGGSGTLLGPIFGAFILVFAEYFVSLLAPQRWPLIVGLLFVVIVMYAKGGIITLFERAKKGR